MDNAFGFNPGEKAADGILVGEVERIPVIAGLRGIEGGSADLVVALLQMGNQMPAYEPPGTGNQDPYLTHRPSSGISCGWLWQPGGRQGRRWVRVPKSCRR